MNLGVIILAFLSVATGDPTPLSPTNREKQMIDELNFVRTNPKEYAQFIDEYLKEGRVANGEERTASELRKFLLKMEPVDSLHFSEELYIAALTHGKWMKKRGTFKHSKYQYAENLVTGNQVIRHSVIDLLIDHGVRGRGHRKNILNPLYKTVACHEIEGKVGPYDFVFVQEFQ